MNDDDDGDDQSLIISCGCFRMALFLLFFGRQGLPLSNTHIYMKWQSLVTHLFCLKSTALAFLLFPFFFFSFFPSSLYTFHYLHLCNNNGEIQASLLTTNSLYHLVFFPPTISTVHIFHHCYGHQSLIFG